MKQTKRFNIDVYLANGSCLETTFFQALDEGQAPAARFYLGFSSDAVREQDLPWIAVGDIAYLPDEVVAVKVSAVENGESPPLRPRQAK
ncbi:MAG: hypothetical protein KGJ86_18615 [Chloroflexota bacterium]|nr:hypothetical protein [Chloroflexota bacterium]